MTAHPGFGSFLKEHKEFFDALDEEGWEAVPGFDGVETKVLSGTFDHENQSGAMTKVTRWAPGTVSPEPSIHDWCEECCLSLDHYPSARPITKKRLGAQAYAVRPADVPARFSPKMAA